MVGPLPSECTRTSCGRSTSSRGCLRCVAIGPRSGLRPIDSGSRGLPSSPIARTSGRSAPFGSRALRATGEGSRLVGRAADLCLVITLFDRSLIQSLGIDESVCFDQFFVPRGALRSPRTYCVRRASWVAYLGVGRFRSEKWHATRQSNQ